MVTILRVGQLKYKVNKKDLLTLEIMDDSTEFSVAMVRKIVTYIAEHKEELLDKWVEYHEED